MNGHLLTNNDPPWRSKGDLLRLTKATVAIIIASNREKDGKTVNRSKKLSFANNTLLWLIACCLIVAGVVLLQRDAGKVGQITIEEQGDFYTTEELYIGTPKDTKKSATLTYTDASVDSFVFLRVNAQYWQFDEATSCYSTVNGQVHWNVDSVWTYFLTEEEEQIYYIFVPADSTLEKMPIVADEIVKVAGDINPSQYHATAREGLMYAEFSAVAAYAAEKQGDEAVRAKAAWGGIAE